VTNYMHKASGTSPSGQFWSFGLNTTGSISEAAAQASWHARVVAFFATAGVAALYKTTTVLTLTSTSTASATWHQTTLTSNVENQAGTATTQELPEQMALVASLQSATRDRSGHGRMFLPAPVAAALTANTGGNLLQANATTLATAATTWFNGLASDGIQPLILTRKATANHPAYSTRLVTSRRFDNTLHIQKRRGDKRTPIYTSF
jgi:hypothetical protein